jgi:hypothetical protein
VDRPAVLRIPLAILALAGTPMIASCSNEAATNNGGPARTGQIRADTLAGVAKRIYRQEVRGEVGHAAVKRISHDRALLAALSTGNRTALRAAALRQLFDPGKHVVRLSIVRSGRTLTNVGGAFVVAPAVLSLHARSGIALGRVEASMQDVIGYVKLVKRLTGADVVVRGQPGHVESSLAAPPAALPSSGSTTIAGVPYLVRSFPETGFGGEQLTVWILARATTT